mmetsp:Transcript_58738/g.130916  ORF Transcript_58738/g.130916 Transcript_58738/m.130916 type:complete len:98 (-) Transcript_58738:251-544(-)
MPAGRSGEALAAGVAPVRSWPFLGTAKGTGTRPPSLANEVEAKRRAASSACSCAPSGNEHEAVEAAPDDPAANRFSVESATTGASGRRQQPALAALG